MWNQNTEYCFKLIVNIFIYLQLTFDCIIVDNHHKCQMSEARLLVEVKEDPSHGISGNEDYRYPLLLWKEIVWCTSTVNRGIEKVLVLYFILHTFIIWTKHCHPYQKCFMEHLRRYPMRLFCLRIYEEKVTRKVAAERMIQRNSLPTPIMPPILVRRVSGSMLSFDFVSTTSRSKFMSKPNLSDLESNATFVVLYLQHLFY